MSLQELEARIEQLPPEQLRRFAEWWESFRKTALGQPLPTEGTAPEAESESVKGELLRRQQEYHEHPERFVTMDAAALDQMLREIDEEVRTSPH